MARRSQTTQDPPVDDKEDLEHQADKDVGDGDKAEPAKVEEPAAKLPEPEAAKPKLYKVGKRHTVQLHVHAKAGAAPHLKSFGPGSQVEIEDDEHAAEMISRGVLEDPAKDVDDTPPAAADGTMVTIAKPGETLDA